MKAFEEWWTSKIGTYYKHHPESIAKDGWKAALEWVMKEFAYALAYEKYWIIEAIERELKDVDSN